MMKSAVEKNKAMKIGKFMLVGVVKVTFYQTSEGSEPVAVADICKKRIQVVGTVVSNALRREHFWCAQGWARIPVWLKLGKRSEEEVRSEREGPDHVEPQSLL